VDIGIGIRDHFLVPTIDAPTPTLLIYIMTMCWNPSPEERPTSKRINDLFKMAFGGAWGKPFGFAANLLKAA